ncbi:hypothetical protein [Herpetosiphon giganteus]|uniref:hypothetical protein n=1 Tax=Herpetosiphon giganteus TaxID=2029754 RepID=UPI00195C440A|nr:hypothetical protein [Herpetosiphon giganteus]MBM7845387.1 hypothetical protein [Herpetosiphon giganteus]
MTAWIYTIDGEFQDLGAAIEAYRERQRKADEAERRAAFRAAQSDPEVQAWIEIAEREEALRTNARTQRPNKKPMA